MSAGDDFAQVFRGRPAPSDPSPSTAKVVKVDGDGVWVVAIGDDQRYPTGPCRGGWRYALTTDTPPALVHQALDVGTVVLLVHTDDGPWVTAQA